MTYRTWYCAGMRIVAVALVIEAQPLDAPFWGYRMTLHTGFLTGPIGDKNHK